MVHRLVLLQFTDNPENKPEVNHIDGNKNNNCLVNLEWCTNLQNIRHARNLGLYPELKGEKANGSKLNEKSISIIRLSNISQSELAYMFGVQQSLISMVKAKKIWSHVA
jgi:hypothetical protein